ncbi:lysylphosphatidylglycerol synthase transmembrane domain-containing protein [Leifsonia sp. F6_8S_P_1B]|uniref:Lysylphosphatidylglycerol synthase transmembrane domain-containing protein n=1 Tax=Leifsonia williamsii TaxID=3035919 RepID=A0ABT8K8V0_9MICO|nr:lysylphosphatidylglycerol synthase transmembrane domain-containing protein [Leifsonia williamsii]MDN4613883.1 lysylphosphatidylglycerol synthase transmembrane domain-containing protein [Leifsonia williamsii]
MSASVAARGAGVVRLREVTASPWFRPVVRVALGAVVLIAVVLQVGAAPFLAGLAALDVPTVAAAVALTALATAAAAWRWSTVSRALGVPLRWGAAVAMYYRSQFLNSVLPGGVVGDVGRAVDHGRSVERLGPAARAVVIERTIGQVVQLVIAVPVVLLAGTGFGGMILPPLAIGVGGAAATVALAAVIAGVASARARRVLLREAAALRGLGSAGAVVKCVLASVVVCLAHVGTFVVAAEAVGVAIPPPQVVALAFVVLLAASLPIGVGGWGPREGVAGWAFAAAGVGATAGVAAATLFGVVTLLAVLPGAVIPRRAFTPRATSPAGVPSAVSTAFAWSITSPTPAPRSPRP